MAQKRKRHPASPETPPRPPAPATAMRARWTALLLVLVCAIMTAGVILFIRQSRIIPPPPAARRSSAPAPGAEIHAAFAGSQSCRECHQEAFDKWARSNHAHAERTMDPALDDPAFVPARSFTHASQSTDIRKDGGQFTIVANGPENQRKPFAAVRAIGVNPLVQYLTPFPGGRLQTFEATWDPISQQWFNVYGTEDRKPGEWGHWSGRGMTWNSMCAVCHNTRLLKNYDMQTDSYQTTMVELGVGCESCHGPMKDHVLWQETEKKRQGDKGTRRQGEAPVTQPQSASSGLRTQDSGLPPQSAIPKDPTLKKITRRQMFETCAGCHSRRAELTGNFAPRDSYYDHHWLTIPDASNIFYPDGQIRDEDYEFTSFLGSRMYAGGVRCVDCHEPHGSKPLLQGNALCMKCHSGSFPNAPIIDPAAHTFHKPDSTGSLCVNCHMPQTVYMQKHWRHDHGFTIPDPLLTKEQEIPNACNRCHDHQKESVDWAIAAVDKWYGEKMDRPSRHRARAVAQARHARPEAREALVKILREERIVMWRAVAANLLGAYLDSPEARSALLEAARHNDPLVRENAVRALEPLAGRDQPATEAMQKLLEDPIRAVRVRAAWAMRSGFNPSSKAGSDLLTYLDQNSDQPAGLMQLGILRLTQRNVGGAVDLFRKAVQWDPNSAPFRDALAVGLSARGEILAESSPQEARRLFEQAMEQARAAAQLEPGDPELQYKLALAYGALDDYGHTIECLRQVVKLSPRHARAWYNLGLALAKAQQPRAAIDALNTAEQLSPAEPDIPYALATLYAQQQKTQEARDAARRALKIAPGYRPALSLLQQLGE